MGRKNSPEITVELESINGLLKEYTERINKLESEVHTTLLDLIEGGRKEAISKERCRTLLLRVESLLLYVPELDRFASGLYESYSLSDSEVLSLRLRMFEIEASYRVLKSTRDRMRRYAP